jgi:hypothetical protein
MKFKNLMEKITYEWKFSYSNCGRR